MEDQRRHILGVDQATLQTQLKDLGMPTYRAAQVLQWIYRHRVDCFAEMKNVAAEQRELLDRHYRIFTSTPARSEVATDGTQKLLLRWPDGAHTETVLIPADSDAEFAPSEEAPASRRTACISTQVGCPVGCAFCASGLLGLQRNLTAGEVVEQALRLAHLPGPERRITNVVFMGMGEPLANYNTTLAAIRTLMAPWGFHISARKITVSTVGLPPQMHMLAAAGLPVTLAISLHAPNNALRQKIIPWARGIALEKIVEAGRHYFDVTGREVTLEYIMLSGVNTLPEHARELATLARQMRANVNLIYYNEVPDLPFQRPAGTTMLAFQQILRSAGVNAHVRKSRGREIAAACGQLARQESQRTAAVQLTVPGVPAS